MFVATKHKRGKRKLAKTQHTPSAPAPDCPDNSISLPIRTTSEIDLTLPPPYAVVCPRDHRNHLHENGLLPCPQPTAPTTSTNVPPLQPSLRSSRSQVVQQATGSSFIEDCLQDTTLVQGSWQTPSLEDVAHVALSELISKKFDSVITSIDGEAFGGAEDELVIQDEPQSGIRGGWGITNREVSRGANRAISSAVTSTNYFAKANLYANSKLPRNLPPLKL